MPRSATTTTSSSDLPAPASAGVGTTDDQSLRRPEPPGPRPLLVRVGWTLRDYAKRVWDNAGEDNIFFLAGGIAFNLLLAAVPFILLLVSGLAVILDRPAVDASRIVSEFIDRLLPEQAGGVGPAVHGLIDDVIRASPTVGIWSAITFVWFSTRLFGSLRSVLADVFDIEHERGIVAGKLFDVQITIIATLLFVAYSVLSAYLALATTRGIQVLAQVGLRQSVMGGVEYFLGRVIAFAFIVLMFFALYKYLPNRRIRWRTALLAALVSSGLFELARNAFTSYVRSFDPGSLYQGTLAALVIVVFWIYYAALLFILGGEVAQVYELRRVRRQQRETLEG